MAAALDHVIVEASSAELASDFGVVVAAVEVEGVDLVEPAVGGDGLDSRLQQADVVAIGAVDGPAERDAVTVDADGPLPTAFGPVTGVRTGAVTTVGALSSGPSIANTDRSKPVIQSNDAIASAST